MSAWNEQTPQDVRDIELHREVVVDWFGEDAATRDPSVYDWEKEDDDEDAG